MEQYVKYIMEVADNVVEENSNYSIKETNFGSELSLTSMTIYTDRSFFCEESTQEYFHYFITGKGEVKLNGHTYPALPGTVVTVPKGISYSIINKGKINLYTVCVTKKVS